MKNEAAQCKRLSDGKVRIMVPRRRPSYMVRPVTWIVPIRSTRTIQLDSIGVQVWDFCDGRRRVEDVVDRIADSYRLTFHEARVAVTSYIKMLIERSALVIVMPK